MRRCVIVGAGEVRCRICVREGDLLIAADGGYDHLLRASLTPDILIGDFDSIAELPHLQNVEIIRHPAEKDETDMYLAYRIGFERGCDEFYIYGGIGGREDHTFANYCLLLDAKNDKKQVYLVSDRYKIFVIKDEKISLEPNGEKTVSVFAFGSDAHGVTLRGLKYEAEGITLSHSFPLGVSNSFKKGTARAEISVENGALLVMLEL